MSLETAWPYEGYAAACAHWDEVVRKLRAGEPIVEAHPMPTLAQQAAKQIARLERDLQEWKAIQASADAVIAARCLSLDEWRDGARQGRA